MKGVAIEMLAGGLWNAVLVEPGSGAVSQLSPTWKRELKVDEPGVVVEFNKQSKRKEKVKTLITRVIGTTEVRGESLAVAMNRARQYLAEQARAAAVPKKVAR